MVRCCAVLMCHCPLRPVYSDTTQLNSTSSWVELSWVASLWTTSPTQLNCRRRSSMQLTQLQRTANQREAGQSSWVELRRRRYGHFADATQLDVELSWVELCRYKRAFKGITCLLLKTFPSSHTRRPVNSALSAVAAPERQDSQVISRSVRS